jgi:serine/threonine-protein kinase
MGGVWDVEDDAGNHYALKSPASGMDATAETNKRFAREANAVRMLDHPNLVAAVDVFVDAGYLFLVMERVAGSTLTKLIAQGRVAPRRALVLARQLLEGVGHAPAAGLVHRDLKPDNVMIVELDGAERLKIVDFGVVKLIGDAAAAMGGGNLTSTGMVMGTPTYMAPEQAMGGAIDGRTDLYAAGTILFEMLTGRPPFESRDPMTLMRMQVKAPPPRVDMLVKGAPADLVMFVDGALAKDPNHRFQTSGAMIKALDDALRSLS